MINLSLKKRVHCFNDSNHFVLIPIRVFSSNSNEEGTPFSKEIISGSKNEINEDINDRVLREVRELVSRYDQTLNQAYELESLLRENSAEVADIRKQLDELKESISRQGEYLDDFCSQIKDLDESIIDRYEDSDRLTADIDFDDESKNENVRIINEGGRLDYRILILFYFLIFLTGISIGGIHSILLLLN